MDTIQTRDWAYSASASSLGSVSVTSSLSPSDCTTTTSSTVPGLGEFSGRAILALGKLTLRGAEYVILRRRLDVISAKFPHQNTDKFLGIDQMYKDILEFSRCVQAKFYLICHPYPSNRRDFYLDTIRDRALTMILVQIGSRQTQKLIEHLLKWPFIEIKIFITELTTVFDPLKCARPPYATFVLTNANADCIRCEKQGDFLVRYERIPKLYQRWKTTLWSRLSSSYRV